MNIFEHILLIDLDVLHNFEKENEIMITSKNKNHAVAAKVLNLNLGYEKVLIARQI